MMIMQQRPLFDDLIQAFDNLLDVGNALLGGGLFQRSPNGFAAADADDPVLAQGPNKLGILFDNIFYQGRFFDHGIYLPSLDLVHHFYPC
jgi:hypothetical protein